MAASIPVPEERSAPERRSAPEERSARDGRSVPDARSARDAEIRALRRELAVLRLRRRNARRVALAAQAIMRPYEYVAMEYIVLAALIAVAIAVVKSVKLAIAFAVIMIGGALLTKLGFRFWNLLVARRGLKETGRIRVDPKLEHAPGGPLDDQIRALQQRLRTLRQEARGGRD